MGSLRGPHAQNERVVRFVDDDGAAYHVRTGFDIVLLNENYTGPTGTYASFSTPESSEGPVMFKRDGV